MESNGERVEAANFRLAPTRRALRLRDPFLLRKKVPVAMQIGQAVAAPPLNQRGEPRVARPFRESVGRRGVRGHARREQSHRRVDGSDGGGGCEGKHEIQSSTEQQPTTEAVGASAGGEPSKVASKVAAALATRGGRAGVATTATTTTSTPSRGSEWRRPK